jgi:hypothetical protein
VPMYIALYGSYEGQPLYFDVLSGRKPDDLAEAKNEFAFRDKESFDLRRAGRLGHSFRHA